MGGLTSATRFRGGPTFNTHSRNPPQSYATTGSGLVMKLCPCDVAVTFRPDLMFLPVAAALTGAVVIFPPAIRFAANFCHSFTSRCTIVNLFLPSTHEVAMSLSAMPHIPLAIPVCDNMRDNMRDNIRDNIRDIIRVSNPSQGFLPQLVLLYLPVKSSCR